MRIGYFIGILFILNCSPVLATKKACQPYLDKLRNIQSQQRAGYNNKKGRSLAEREKKARDKWWKCQQGKLPKNKRNKLSKKSKKKNNSHSYINSKNRLSKVPVSKYSNALTIKAKYQGKMQQDWLDYYQQPAKCKKPKSTKVFAFCIEDERKQQQRFSSQY